jgi:hypothetical protein
MLRLDKGDARERLKQRGRQPLIEPVTYPKILCRRCGVVMGNGAGTKLTGDKANEKQELKKSTASEPTPTGGKKVQDGGLDGNQKAHELDKETIDLPDSYGETRAVLMAIGPDLLHVYWEVTSQDLDEARGWFDDARGQPQTILRFYDVTNAVVGRGKAHEFFDVDIDLYSRSRYVRLWKPEKSYFVELGFKTADGRFFPLVRSNVAKTPSAWPAPRVDEQDAALLENAEEQIRPQKEQKAQHQGEIAQEMDAVQTVPTRFVEGRKFEARNKPSSESAPSLKQEAPGEAEKGDEVDMTQMNEEAFALGVSSERGASPQKKKESADD